MPPLLHSAALKPDVQVADAEDSEEEEDIGDVSNITLAFAFAPRL